MKHWLILLGVLAAIAHAENWPQWRGPRLDGTSAEANLRFTKWTAADKFFP
jgi:hypothetical protein